MRSVELFAGGGGLALGTHLAGFSTELVAEWDARSDAEKNSAHSQAVDGGGRSHNPEGPDSDVTYQVAQQAKPGNCIKGLTQLGVSLTVLVY